MKIVQSMIIAPWFWFLGQDALEAVLLWVGG